MPKLKIDIEERLLHFKEPAGTSRGVYTTRRIWLVRILTPDKKVGTGECAPLPDLSCDAFDDYAIRLRHFCDIVESTGNIPCEELRNYPSMLFGLETAWLNAMNSGNTIFDTPFSRGEIGIPINGLIWMGSYEEMSQRLQQKIDLGFRCIKLKIGAIDFDRELELIRRIRRDFSREQVELRVDANGAFSPDEALDKLRELARYDIHSIEQPIRQGNIEKMSQLCSETPLDIALDEELIGVNDPDDKRHLLDTIKPQYIILKPSLHGGISGSKEWIELARERGIGSWITSALESNMGLNAVAQFAAKIYGDNITMPQGLGTGQLFTDNIPMPLHIEGDELWIKPTMI